MLELQVGKARVGEPGVERDAGGGEEQFAGLDILEICSRLVAAEGQRRALELAARHMHGVAGRGAEQQRDVERVGDDGQRRASQQLMSDLGCGRAGVEAGGPRRIITSAKVSSNTVIPGYQRVRG